MALPSPSSTPLGPRDSPPAGSPLPTSQGGSGDEAKAAVARKTKEVEHLLANLEKEGVVINGKIASIVDDEIAKIQAEAEREVINDPIMKGIMILHTISYFALGFFIGVEWLDNAFRKELDKDRRA